MTSEGITTGRRPCSGLLRAGREKALGDQTVLSEESFKARVHSTPLLFLDSSRLALLDRTAIALTEHTGQGHNTHVVGPRTVGKTTMLNALVQAARGCNNRWGPLYSLYINGSSLDDDGFGHTGFGPWLAAALEEQGFPQDLVFCGTTGLRTFRVIDEHLADANATLFLVLDEVDTMYKHAWGCSVLTFLINANNSLEERHRVRFILSSSAAVTRGLCYLELPDGIAPWTTSHPMYCRIGSFNSRKCVPFQLDAPATFEEFRNTVLRVCCEAANALWSARVELTDVEPQAFDDSDAEEALGGSPTTSDGGLLLLPPSFARELFRHYRGQVDKLQNFIRTLCESKSVKAATDALPSMDTVVAGVAYDVVQRHFKVLWRAMRAEDRAAALVRSSLFHHSLEAHAAALGVCCDPAFVREIHALCDKGVLMAPGGPRDFPNVVGFAHTADVIHASLLFPSAGQSSIVRACYCSMLSTLLRRSVIHCTCARMSPDRLHGAELIALELPGGSTESKLAHEGIVLESLTTAPIEELAGVEFTFSRESRCLSFEHLADRARWTGQLFQPKQKDDSNGVDAVAVCVTDETVVTVYLIQVWVWRALRQQRTPKQPHVSYRLSPLTDQNAAVRLYQQEETAGEVQWWRPRWLCRDARRSYEVQAFQPRQGNRGCRESWLGRRRHPCAQIGPCHGLHRERVWRSCCCCLRHHAAGPARHAEVLGVSTEGVHQSGCRPPSCAARNRHSWPVVVACLADTRTSFKCPP